MDWEISINGKGGREINYEVDKRKKGRLVENKMKLNRERKWKLEIRGDKNSLWKI